MSLGVHGLVVRETFGQGRIVWCAGWFQVAHPMPTGEESLDRGGQLREICIAAFGVTPGMPGESEPPSNSALRSIREATSEVVSALSPEGVAEPSGDAEAAGGTVQSCRGTLRDPNDLSAVSVVTGVLRV
ncbi:MAG: hypothetical protein M5U19_09265 [Microthrixaceae bacterium]|nr:hypothetical protein [Microthrixaceae bacterium]